MVLGGLFERADELARIDGLLAAARAGRGGLILVTGPAGIGKTALTAAARDSALGAGMRVLSGRGRELEGEFSFGVARQLLQPLLTGAAERRDLLTGAARHALIALEGTDGGMAPAASDALFAAVHGLYWLLVNAAGHGPLLVAVDDLHWADQASLRFVSYLAVRLEGLPVALMLCWRAGETGAAADFVARMEDAAAGSVVRPSALSVEGVQGMIGRAFEAAPVAGLAAECHAATGGNPFLVRELIRGLEASGIAFGNEAVAQVARLGPRSVARSVTSRTARLGPAAGEVAQAAAILGDGAQLRHVTALAGIEVGDVAAAADNLAAVGVLEPGTPLRFVHPIVRTAIYDDIPHAERGLRHGAAAGLLAAEGADLDQVCAHLLACPPSGSAEVVQRLRQAAARAMTRGAAESAAVYLRRALDEAVGASMRAGLLHELGRAEMVTGDRAAVQHLRAALDLTPEPLPRAEIAADLAQLMLAAAQWEAGIAVVQTALGDVTAAGQEHDARAVRLLAWWASFAGYDPRRVTQLDADMEHLLAAAWGDAAGSRLLAGALATRLASRGERFDHARGLLDRALQEGHLAAQIGTEAPLVAEALSAALFLDDLPRAASLVSWLLMLARSHSSVIGVSVAACMEAGIQVRRGDLSAAEANIRQIADLAAAYDLPWSLPQALFWGVDALIERPGLADLAALARAVEPPPEVAPTLFGATLSEVRGRLALADGDFAAARAELRAAAVIYQAMDVVNPNATRWRSALALAIAAENHAEALRLADSELDDARRLGFLRPAAIALRTRGLVVGGEQGLSDLGEAARMLAGTGARLEHARALVELGAALRRGNQRIAAREPLRSGLDLAHKCGAIRLAERATDELRATGARPRRDVLTGLEALTASERRIAELAAEGLSNPAIAQALFITLNTVEGHLRRAYQKLSINSRSQLLGALASVAPEG